MNETSKLPASDLRMIGLALQNYKYAKKLDDEKLKSVNGKLIARIIRRSADLGHATDYPAMCEVFKELPFAQDILDDALDEIGAQHLRTSTP